MLVFFTGGSSRQDVQSLLILRPMSILACGFAIIALRTVHLAGREWLLGGFVAAFGLSLLHLLPLPPISHRSIVNEIDVISGVGQIWRPLTLASTAGWQSMFSFFTPLAVLLLGLQLNRDDLYRLLPLLIGLGALSGMFGMLQVIGDPESPLFLYRITNNGNAVGLFANRNHAAVLLACLLPMLASYASVLTGSGNRQNVQGLMASSIGIVIVPLVIITGSRSGMLIALLGLIGAALLYRRQKKFSESHKGDTILKISSAPLLSALVVLCLGLLTLLFSRAEAIDRLLDQPAAENSRIDIWVAALDLFWKYFPLGSGSGSFADAFQVDEPLWLLTANHVNKAHNDFIETGITLGTPALLLLLVGIALYGRKTFRLWRHGDAKQRTVSLARMAGIVLGMLGLASFTDYPLRTPIMMCYVTVLTLWFVEGGRDVKKVSGI